MGRRRRWWWVLFRFQASDDYERMMGAEAELKQRVLGCFAAATKQGDAASVAKYCALLGPLGLAAEGVKGYLSFAKQALAAVTDEALATGAALSVSTPNYRDPVTDTHLAHLRVVVFLSSIRILASGLGFGHLWQPNPRLSTPGNLAPFHTVLALNPPRRPFSRPL
jgi:hypothetical protein